MGFILGKTPSKFSQNIINTTTKGFGKVEKGYGIARNGISNSLYKGSMGCLREKFRLPNQNSVEDIYFKIFKG